MYHRRLKEASSHFKQFCIAKICSFFLTNITVAFSNQVVIRNHVFNNCMFEEDESKKITGSVLKKNYFEDMYIMFFEYI